MSVRKDKRNGKWMYDGKYKDIFGKYKSYHKSGFNTKREAAKSELEFLESTKPSRSMTLDSLVDMYNENNTQLKEQTIRVNMIHYNKRIKPYFGHLSIDNINAQMISKWLLELVYEGLKENTVNLYKSILSKYLNYAVKMDLLVKNPCSRVSNYKDVESVKEEIKVFDKETFREFISNVKEPFWYDVFIFLYYTGVRRGELGALKWNDINFESRKIRINKTLTEKKKITPPKTEKSNRYIDINDTLYNALFERFESQKRLDGFTLDFFVFGDVRPINFSLLRNKAWYYGELVGFDHLHPHIFRHSNASLLIKSRKFDDGVIAERLGHTVEMLRKTYAHVYEDMRIDLSNELENIL